MTRSRRIAVALAATLGVSALAVGGMGAPGARADQAGRAAPANDHRTIAIGIDVNQPGLALTGEYGEPSGFDADVATYVAKYLGYSPVQINWVAAPSSDRAKLIEEGKVRFVVAAYSMTPARERLVTFAGPYLVAGQDIMVRAGNKSITGPYALNGETVCAATGSDSGPKILDFSPEAKLAFASAYSGCVEELGAHRVDAVTADDVILAGYITAYPGQFKIVGSPFTKERYAVGLKKGDVALQEKITAAIEKMISSGSWQQDVDATIGASGYKTLPPPPVFNIPANVQMAGGDQGAGPSLVAVAKKLVDKANRGEWRSFYGLACPPMRASLKDLIKEFTPEYDSAIGPVADGVGFRYKLIGIQQSGPHSGLVFAHEAFTQVPVAYDEYFKDISYVATMVRQHGDWRMCGLAASFAGG